VKGVASEGGGRLPRHELEVERDEPDLPVLGAAVRASDVYQDRVLASGAGETTNSMSSRSRRVTYSRARLIRSVSRLRISSHPWARVLCRTGLWKKEGERKVNKSFLLNSLNRLSCPSSPSGGQLPPGIGARPESRETPGDSELG